MAVACEDESLPLSPPPPPFSANFSPPERLDFLLVEKLHRKVGVLEEVTAALGVIAMGLWIGRANAFASATSCGQCVFTITRSSVNSATNSSTTATFIRTASARNTSLKVGHSLIATETRSPTVE